MAQDGNGMPGFQFPPEMVALAEQSVAQARKAFDGMISSAQQAVSQFEGQATGAQVGATDLAQKAVGFAQQNLGAACDYAQRLTQAKTLNDVMRLHAEYVRKQMEAFTEQVGELSRAAAKSTARQPRPLD